MPRQGLCLRLWWNGSAQILPDFGACDKVGHKRRVAIVQATQGQAVCGQARFGYSSAFRPLGRDELWVQLSHFDDREERAVRPDAEHVGAINVVRRAQIHQAIEAFAVDQRV